MLHVGFEFVPAGMYEDEIADCRTLDGCFLSAYGLFLNGHGDEALDAVVVEHGLGFLFVAVEGTHDVPCF